MMARARGAALPALLVILAAQTTGAHDGPPFPILSSHEAGPYAVSIWTDPDTTDNGSAGGQFWVRLKRAGGPGDLPADTRATVAIRPLDRAGPALTAVADPVRGDVTNQFAALVMDHEGRFGVHVVVEGPLGRGEADAQVEATYDSRPSPILLVVYLIPFLVVGLLWGRLLIRRRSMPAGQG
jgi:hypothetical protein